MTKITIERSWKKQEAGRVQHLENLRQMQYKERAMIKEVTGITKIPLRWTSKKAHLRVMVKPDFWDRVELKVKNGYQVHYTRYEYNDLSGGMNDYPVVVTPPNWDGQRVWPT